MARTIYSPRPTPLETLKTTHMYHVSDATIGSGVMIGLSIVEG